MFGDINKKKTIIMSYTKDSAADLNYKFEQIRYKLSGVDLGDLEFPSELNIKTMGSFFDELIYEYAEEFNIDVISKRLYVLNDFERVAIIKDVVTTLIDKDMLHITVYDGLYSKLLSLYTQIKEKNSLEDRDTWCRCTEFKGLEDIQVNELAKIYEVYEKIKRAKKSIELSEYACIANLILQNKYIRARWQEKYRVAVVDEFQDVTEAQVAVLRTLFNNEENPDSYLFCVGDGDQAIYGFRGAHSNGCYNFMRDFGGDNVSSARCYMTLNRRCPTEVLASAKKIIETLNTRMPKKLTSNKSGGNVSIEIVNSVYDEVRRVKELLSSFDNESLANTVIAYRSNRSARIIKWELENEGYKVKSNSRIVDRFEESLTGSINLLADPSNLDLASKHLMKMLPKSKEFNMRTIKGILEEERISRSKGHAMKCFYELDFISADTPSTFPEAMRLIYKLSLCLRGEVGKDLERLTKMEPITKALVNALLKPYYLQFQASKTDTEGGDNLFDAAGNIIDPYSLELFKYYSQPITWQQFKLKEARKNQKLANSFREVNMSTFHSLKGLEFKNVILVDLRDSVFPGYELKEATKFGSHFVKEADDEAKRLFYVAMTRSKENLYMIFRKDNPTRYLTYLGEDKVEDIDGEFDFDALEETQEFDLVEEQTESAQEEDDSRDTLLNRWLDD